MALLFYHEDEIGEGGRVASSSGARAENSGDLRNNSRRYRVLIEDRGISRETVYTFLYTSSPRVVERDDGSTVFQCQLLNFYDLCSIAFAQRTSVCREIIGIDEYQTSVNFSVSCNHAVSGNLFFLHSEVGAPVRNEFIEFVERPFIE